MHVESVCVKCLFILLFANTCEYVTSPMKRNGISPVNCTSLSPKAAAQKQRFWEALETWAGGQVRMNSGVEGKLISLIQHADMMDYPSLLLSKYNTFYKVLLLKWGYTYCASRQVSTINFFWMPSYFWLMSYLYNFTLTSPERSSLFTE